MVVASGRDAEALRNLLYTAQAEPRGPFAIRYPRGAADSADWRKPFRVLPVGKSERLRDGDAVAVLTIGPVASEAAKAIEMAGVDAAHYDVIYLKPLDEDMLREVAAKGCPIVTVEDGTVNGGLGSAVAEWMTANGRGASGRWRGLRGRRACR